MIVILPLLNSVCSQSVYGRNCREVWHTGKKISQEYVIDVDGDGPLEPIAVYCEMNGEDDPHDVWTVLHHDLETLTYVRGYESAGAYERNMTYGNATEAHLMALIDSSFSCQQYIKWSCKGAMFGFWYPPDLRSWWVGRHWKDQYYWGGAETDSWSCGCHPYCYPTKRNSTCNCDDNPKVKWLHDEGLLLDTSRLPVLGLRFGDTGESNEAGEHLLGPLKCRATGHRIKLMENLRAPITLMTPHYGEKGAYPPPFYNYTWTVEIPENENMELLFPDYDVIHYGSYNSVPGCRHIVTVKAIEANTNRTVIIARQKSPPYYASSGSRTILNITFTTCNQDENLPKSSRGFKAYIKKSVRYRVLVVYNFIFKNSFSRIIYFPEIIFFSEGYPFPHLYYFSSEEDFINHQHYVHTWNLRVSGSLLVELEFKDFDVPATAGSRNCTEENGVLWIYNGEGTERKNLIGGFCNLNKEGIIHSTTSAMTLVYVTRWRKVGNGRGFHAVYRGVKKPASVNEDKLVNVAEGKPTKQSSTMNGRYAFLGVDGNTNSAAGFATCTATEFERDPWWQVDLQKRYHIYGFELYSTKSENQERAPEEGWPDGQYGLPMPVCGCPTGTGFEWKKGLRYQDMQYDIIQDSKVLHWSWGMLLKGGLQKFRIPGSPLLKTAVEQHFCVKTENSTKHRKWPPGEYCILQYGDTCPEGFDSGYITWIDTRRNASESRVNGALPTGNYTAETTRIFFCCRKDGSAQNMIRLPKDAPFYLLKFQKYCQKVEGMSVTEQFFHFNEDVPSLQPSGSFEDVDGMEKYKKPHPSIDKGYEKGIALEYCYYDISQSLRGFRVTVDDSGLINTFTRFYDELSYSISHTEVGLFLNSYACYVYPVTMPEFTVLKVNCSQPIYGQFVTLHVYNRFDSLRFCEIKVFAKESCGQPLGLASEEIFDSAITASSSDDVEKYSHFHTNARLNANQGWCAKHENKNPELTVDLLNITTVTGIILQGLNGAPKKTIAKQFYVFFSNDSTSWVSEEEPVGQQKVYVCDQCGSSEVFTNDLPLRFNFLKGIRARLVKIQIIESYEQPCLRLEILGCRERVKCEHTIETTEGWVKSPNYPNYYGMDKSCDWIIKPKDPGRNIELDFIVYDLAQKEDCLDSGSCRDELIVYPEFNKKKSFIKSPDGKLFPKTIISKGEMRVHLHSCFRNSRSRYRGFLAKFKLVDCPGCGIGDFQCSEQHLCSSDCGTIISIGYPLKYQNNHRCGWLIRAQESRFINLTFQDFDIIGGENCQYDYLSVFDGDKNHKSNLIGRFCNEKKPPPQIISSWNTLLLEFSSDVSETGRGFSIKYTSTSFQIPQAQIDDLQEQSACPRYWKYYNGNCYRVFDNIKPIQWFQAEDKCRKMHPERNSHLVSILDEKENAVVHYLLINVFGAKQKSLYIGLNDDASEGIYRWSDKNPMVYTDWAPSDRTIRSQPDGGAYQDCTMLRVDSGHSTAHWHDIPCSLGLLAFNNFSGLNFGSSNSSNSPYVHDENEIMSSVSHYICKMKRNKTSNQIATQSIPELIGRNASLHHSAAFEKKHKYFICDNNELISILNVCNQLEDCRDGSDEKNCTVGECKEFNFECKNSECISMAEYCNYREDCDDGSDELSCNFRPCSLGEFRCKNGQCIPQEQRCDLLYNCFDKSDEEQCRGFCNPKTAFQCYDGTCIPGYTLCDGHTDCPGIYHEDEQFKCSRTDDRKGKDEEKKLCSRRSRKTCLDIYTLDGVRENGFYTIDSDGSDGPIQPFTVFCEMGPTPDKVYTIIHHDSEESIYVRSNRDGPGSYSRVLVYSVGIEKIKALTNASKSCRQNIKWECSGTGFYFDSGKPWSWWVSRDDEIMYMWGGAKKNYTCGCAETGCRDSNRTCNCDGLQRFEKAVDEGTLTDKNTLPVKEVRFGFTAGTGQSGYHTIGPLNCSGNAVEPEGNCTNTTNYMKCRTGHYVPVIHKCLYEFDMYGYHQGCRDVHHLRNCESFVCPQDYVKCPSAYCIPTTYVCDGKWDCVAGADEEKCENYTCPGQYKCYNSSSCVPLHKLCDGIKNCHEGDDEILCDLVCPANCTCSGLYVTCQGLNATTLPDNLTHEIRKLDFSYNRLDLFHTNFSNFWALGELILQYNEITILPREAFVYLTNMYKLDLSHNSLVYIEQSAFAGLRKVRILILEDNSEITDVGPGAFDGLTAEGGLKLYSDSYTLCCMALPQVPLNNCMAPPDEISSCEDLLRHPAQRTFLWVIGIIGLLGNMFVIFWRFTAKDAPRISSTLILSLGCADFLMGIYLIIIASVDVYYRGIYIKNSERWKRSALCKTCGFLSTVSSEVSVFTLAFITIDRLITLCFPLSHKRFSLNLTYKLIITSWVLAATMAVIPLLVEPYFEGGFYARSGVCLALHITNDRPAGWEYSIAIFFCVNSMAFAVIVSAYSYIYVNIRRSYKNMSRLMSRQSRTDKIGRQMALIVMTNSMCWFPIIIMSLLAMSGVNIPGEAFSWTAIFVLPLNSATNPLIYTISSLHIRAQLLSRFGLNSEDTKGSCINKLSTSHPNDDKSKRLMTRDQLNSWQFRPPQGYVSLLQYLRTVPGLRPRHLLKIATSIVKTLSELHGRSYALGGIDVNAVFVSDPADGSDEIHVYVPDFNAYKIESSRISGMPDDTAVDMEEFGLLLKKMLRVYHVVSRSNDPMQGTAC
ncbi:G-protein coupled receptor GRL101 like protein [Argiope bruennichi]|uniref:G-protein coupled receptor GRL101 like protein n=1 Tax=Argiope bruennichi TaxID=94029 RepID=A0A8T0FCK0_ARGBR|nr:G-protein coupled receptor GRL101 like protein [Argiope bruennichi]